MANHDINHNKSTHENESASKPQIEQEYVPDSDNSINPKLMAIPPTARGSIKQQQQTVMMLQRTMGNAYAARQVQRLRGGDRVQRDPTVIEGDPITITGRVTTLGAGRTPVQEIDNAITDMQSILHQFQTNYLTGIDNWQTTMQFASDQETEAQPIQAALKSAAGLAWDAGIAAVSKEIPGISQTITILTAMKTEFERAEAASGQVQIRDYIVRLRTAFVNSMNNHIPNLQAQRRVLSDEYARISTTDGHDGTATSEGVVVGEGANFLQNLRTTVTQFQTALRSHTPDVVRQHITEGFATTGSSVVRGTMAYFTNGTLYLHCDVYREGNTWRIDSVGSSWTLQTNAPNPGQLADNLRQSLAAQGMKPHQSGLRKQVMCTIENEVEWSTNDYDNGSFSFTDIENVTINNVGALLHGNDPDEFRKAWFDHGLKDRVEAVTGLSGSGG